jgi:hypothetical protein
MLEYAPGFETCVGKPNELPARRLIFQQAGLEVPDMRQNPESGARGYQSDQAK